MQVGFAVSDITPELGIYLTGYGMPERLATGSAGDKTARCGFGTTPETQ